MKLGIMNEEEIPSYSFDKELQLIEWWPNESYLRFINWFFLIFSHFLPIFSILIYLFKSMLCFNRQIGWDENKNDKIKSKNKCDTSLK